MFGATKPEPPPATSGLEKIRRHAKSWARHHLAIMSRECVVAIGNLEEFTLDKRHTLNEAVLGKLVRYMNIGIDYDAATDAILVKPQVVLPTATLSHPAYVTSNFPKVLRDKLPPKREVRFLD